MATLIFKLCAVTRAHYDKVFCALAIPINVLPQGVSTGLSLFHLKTAYDGCSDPRTGDRSCQWKLGESCWQAKLPLCDTSGLTATSQFQKYTTIGNRFFCILLARF